MVNKKFRFLFIWLTVLLMLPLPQWSNPVAANQVSSEPITNSVSNFYNVIMQAGADPWVYKHKDGYYYNVFVNASGIMIRRSKTITGIDAGERSLAWTPVQGTNYSSNVWAPEMHYLKDTDGNYKWYIYFAADNGTNANHRMYVLENTSENPMTGSWVFKGKITDSTDRWAIDGTVMTINEKHYFIWSGWEETDGSFQNLYIAEMSDPRTISSGRVLISTPEYDWESSPGRINEGPEVTIRGNTINLVYSANGSWTDSYCLGLINAKIGDDLMNPGSWVKQDKPIFSSANGVFGPGHHSLTTSPDGSEDWIIYHSARWPGSGWTRNVRTQKFTWNIDGTPNLGEPVDPNKPIATPSGEPVRQRYEAEAAQLVKDPNSGIGPAIWRESTASDGKKITNIKNANDYAQFTVNVPQAGFYVLSVRNANGSSNGADASHIFSVNGSSGAKLNVVYSDWNRWGASTAKVYLKQGDNSIRFGTGTNLAQIDSMDVTQLEVESELLFDSPGYTLGLGESRSLPVYMVTGTSNSLIESGVSFSSSNKEIADIVGTEIKGLKAGSATITATYNGKTATTTVTVAAEPKNVQSIAIKGLDSVLTSGLTKQLQLTARYNTFEIQDVTAGGTYSSSNHGVAKVTVNGQVYDTYPGETELKAVYGGKEAKLNLTVTPNPSQVPQILTQVKTPSGVTPKFPSVVDVIYKGESGIAEVSWKLEGISFNSLGPVQVPVILTLNGEKISAAVSVEVVPGWGLDEIVNQVHSRIDNFSYPLGEGMGNYSQSAFNALLAKLIHVEEISAEGSLTEEQFNQERSSLAQAEADLLGSLNSTQDGVFYNAYRDFSGDETAKYPFGINVEDLTNGATATVQAENGNKFLRLSTTATSGKANLFLPYAGEVKADSDQRIVIEYRARLNTNFQYANGAMMRNDSGTSNYSMVTAFDTGKIVVQNGASTKVKVKDYQTNTWYKIKMVANWGNKTYTVYIDDVLVATDYNFRHTGGNKLTGQRFGIDGYANASIDFDDFKAMVIGGAKVAPKDLKGINETALGANDGRITGVNASMEWSHDNGGTWSNVAGDTIENLQPGMYWVRYRETNTHTASPHVVLTLTGFNQPPANPDGGIISETGKAGDFPLAAYGSAAAIWVDPAEDASVRRVVKDLKEDIKRVTNLDTTVSSAATLPAGPVVIVGTLDGSTQIKALVQEGKITESEVNAIKDRWEANLIKVIDENTLVIAGSDSRGSIFGVYELSERMGVNPWYFFADAAIKTKNAVYVADGTSVKDMPDVRYRGVFLNDEEKLSRWASEVFKDPDTMGPKTYAKIFELILRLKGNYIWAAMHVNSINNVPGNIDLVKEYGIVLGSSHPDMLLRTNSHEWDEWKMNYAGQKGVNPDTIQYDYTLSKEAVLRYWRETIERHKDTDAQWTLGMRGIHDEAFNVKNLMEPAYNYLGNDLEERKAGLMNEIIRDQQQLLKELLGQEKYAKSFQAFIPYKEVLPIYNHPRFDLPENVTVIWTDDNHGIMRRMPDAVERTREGGHGLYYHASYWAPVDQSYLWLSSIPLALMGEELGKSWEHHIQQSWILNVGDIKPQEAEMTYFIRYGWDVEKYKNQPDQFLKDWIGEHFGSQYSNEVADILTTFYHHANVRKLEHMKDGLFNQTHYGDESSKRMAVYHDLFNRTAAIYQALPATQKLAFYELVQSKINWAYYVNKAYYYADKSNLAFDQGRMASADAMLKLSQEADLAKKAEIARYSTMADGKWKGFIDPENASPPVINQLPPGTPALVLGEPSLGVVVQGETVPQGNTKLIFSPYNQDGKFIDVFNKGAGSINWTAAADQPWVKLSSSAGTVNDETRLWVTIDGMEAHKGATATISISDTATNTTKTIQVAIENPTIALSAIIGYAEADGYVSIETEHFSRLNTNGDKTWQIIHDAGRAFGGDVVRAYAPDLNAVDESAISSTAPSLEYDINLTSTGEFPLEIYRIPTLNAKGKVRFAVSVDGGSPIVVESAAADEGQGTIWVSNLFHMIEKHVVNLPALSAGKHTIKLWMVDSFIMIDKMVLYTGPEGVIPTELGPDESYHHEFNTEFNSGTDSLPRISTAAEPKNIPAGWGAGDFVEVDGKVSLEAEYAMEHDLESESQITADMKAYTVSKRDKASQLAGKIPNAWRLTQSDTGMAMRLPDRGGQWSENAEFPVYSPELTYKINFSNTGTYNVWVRWRYVDNASDSIRGGLDGSLGNFSTDVFFSNNMDEKWHWKNVGKVNVATTAEHSFSLWMREDGLYVDRIYLTKSSETPTDALWKPSLRNESTIGQRLQETVNAKRTEMAGISYPLGNALGRYRQDAYDTVMGALNAADALAKSGTATVQQADEALDAITAAETALDNALVLTQNGMSYHAYRDFSGDEAGKYPYGFHIEGMTNGATATVQEEEGNQFLRLTTTATAGKADLFLPYTGEVKAAADQRIVIEYRSRFNGNFQYANGAMVRNDSGTNNYAMVTAFENASGVHQIKVHKGTSNADKVSVKSFNYNQWHTFKMVANWDARTYTVYMDNDSVPVATDFNFRNTGGSKLTGQRFGVDNMPNGSIDFDDFKVSIINPSKPVTPNDIRDVTPVSFPPVALGTNKAVVLESLPKTVEVTLGSDDKANLNVTWDNETYDATKSGEYLFTGTITLTGVITNTHEHKAAAIVIVTGEPQKVEQAAPEGLGKINETAAGANDGRIIGVDGSMEWSSNYGNTWSSVEGGTILNLPPGTYWVRYRETNTHTASAQMELNILRFSLPGNVTGVSLDKTNAHLYTNYGSLAFQLTAWVEPIGAINKAVTWHTSNSVVASVYDGLVTAHSAGEAIITVTTVDGGYSDTSTVTVSVYGGPDHPGNPPIHVTGLSLDKTSAQLYTNYGSSTVQLTANVQPTDATNKTVTWSTSNPNVATVDEYGLVSVHTPGIAVITATTADGTYSATCLVTTTIYEEETSPYDGHDGSTVPTAPATIIKNEDGSTSTILTDQTTGTLTETTTWPNGDHKVVTKESNGTVTEVFTGQNGSKREVVTRSDGSSRSVVTDLKRVKVETITSSDGEVTADVHLPEGVTQSRITIPVKHASATTVALMVRKDGSRQIIGTSVLTEDGLSFIASGDMTVKLIDNKIPFRDVPDNYWAAEAIAFSASRELFLGTEQRVFAPDASMSRAMLFTVLARLDGAQAEGGANWYSNAQDWAVAAGISDGSAPEAAITREQLITLLHRYAGQSAANGDSKSFADSNDISAWASEAMRWAVATGILNGKPGNLLEPASVVSRAEVSAVLARFIAWRSN